MTQYEYEFPCKQFKAFLRCSSILDISIIIFKKYLKHLYSNFEKYFEKDFQSHKKANGIRNIYILYYFISRVLYTKTQLFGYFIFLYFCI